MAWVHPLSAEVPGCSDDAPLSVVSALLSLADSAVEAAGVLVVVVVVELELEDDVVVGAGVASAWAWG